MATSFSDDSLDFVMTADVSEHIPEPYLAHKEIFRVLKPGGAHIFTVPSNLNSPVDSQRATLTEGGVKHFCEPQLHCTKEDANLVYTVFGFEMLSHLWSMGFYVSFFELDIPKMGIVAPRAFGFVAVKHHEPLFDKVPVGLRNRPLLLL